MSDATLLSVNKPEETVVLDYEGLCASPTADSRNPIDEYYSYVADIIVRAGKPEISSDSVFLGLLLLHLVSCAEMYFRRVFAQLPSICPNVRNQAMRNSLMLGAFNYYSAGSEALGLFEHVSFSTKGEIKSRTKSFLGYDISDRSSLGVALAEFERMCQLRHALVHARGHLWYKNCLDLEVSTTSERVVQLDLVSLQGFAVKSNNVVRAFNAFVSDRLATTWFTEGVMTGKWQQDRRSFSALHRLFYSVNDMVGNGDPKAAYDGLRARLQRR